MEIKLAMKLAPEAAANSTNGRYGETALYPSMTTYTCVELIEIN